MRNSKLSLTALFAAILIIVSALMGYAIQIGAIKKATHTSVIGVLTALVFLLSLLITIMFFMGWRDPFAKRWERPLPWDELIKNLIRLALAVVLVLFMNKLRGKKGLVNNATIFNNTSGGLQAPIHNGSAGVPPSSPPAAPRAPLPSFNSELFPILIGVAVITALTAFGVIFYLRVLKKSERKEMMKKAMAFDRKVEELGLGMFKDPREAVVGIYKNAVLWLEALGIPYRESWTHWEHAKRVMIMKEPFTELTKLFEKAKYAPEKVTWEDAEKALELYNGIRGKLNEL